MKPRNEPGWSQDTARWPAIAPGLASGSGNGILLPSPQFWKASCGFCCSLEVKVPIVWELARVDRSVCSLTGDFQPGSGHACLPSPKLASLLALCLQPSPTHGDTC